MIWMGRLGNLTHLRCRNCGAECSASDLPDPDDEGDEE
jgi:hypothetical protein